MTLQATRDRHAEPLAVIDDGITSTRSARSMYELEEVELVLCRPGNVRDGVGAMT
jgi:hypothetical protein